MRNYTFTFLFLGNNEDNTQAIGMATTHADTILKAWDQMVAESHLASESEQTPPVHEETLFKTLSAVHIKLNTTDDTGEFSEGIGTHTRVWPTEENAIVILNKYIMRKQIRNMNSKTPKYYEPKH